MPIFTSLKKSELIIQSKGHPIKRAILVLVASLTLALPRAWAFTDGSGWAAVSYLIKLVEQSIRHYQQFQTMIQYSKDAQAYSREINSGLEASIRLLESLPIKDEKILGQLRTFQRSLKEIEKIYGVIPKSPDESFQQINDMAVAESLKMVSNATDYAENQEMNSAKLEARSWDMSPKGAMRMQAQVSSQILNKHLR